MKFHMVFLCLMMTASTMTAVADEKLSLNKWIWLRNDVLVQPDLQYKFTDLLKDNTKRVYFFAPSPIGILIGTEDIKKEENGNITTDMWHFVGDANDAKLVRYLRRVVVKDSGNGILSITDSEVADSENQIKFEQLKNEIYRRAWRLPWKKN